MDWVFPSNLLSNSPSRDDGISQAIEKAYRGKTAWFIEDLGNQLSFGRLLVSTAQVLVHRFYVFQSFKQHDRFIVAAAAIFLASKVEESDRKYRHLQTIVRAYYSLRNRTKNPPSETEAKDIEHKIVVAERILLQTLCFDVQIPYPYKKMTMKLKDIKSYIVGDVNEVLQVCINFLNDSYRTTLCVQYLPDKIAIAAIFLATVYLGIQPTNINGKTRTEQTWFELLKSDIDEDALKDICFQMADMYTLTSPIGNTVINMEKMIPIQSWLSQPGSLFSTQQISAQSPNTVANPPSGPYPSLPIEALEDKMNVVSSHQIDDLHQEVDLSDPYPYDEDTQSHPVRTVEIVKQQSMTTSRQTYPTPSPSVSSVSSTPPPPPLDTPSHDVGRTYFKIQFTVPDTPEATPPPPPPPDTPDSRAVNLQTKLGTTEQISGKRDRRSGSIDGYDSEESFSSPPPPPPESPAFYDTCYKKSRIE